MSDEYQDPSGNTQAFRAFAQRDEPATPKKGPNLPLIIGGAVAAVVILLVLALLFLG